MNLQVKTKDDRVTHMEEILVTIEKPSRYLGNEVNAVRKRLAGPALTFCLAFPDTYEVGMSHLGLQILYGLLNNHPQVAAERCFAPWPDMEDHLRKNRLPLTSLETARPLADFDMVGFSLQYELSYTNILNMLDLGRIPLRQDQRNEKHPLVIAGGPCAFNPAPLTDFFDAFVIGEGEEVVPEVVEVMLAGKKAGMGRDDLLSRLSELDGLYVPTKSGSKTIRKRTVADLERAYFPHAPVVPLMKAVHDRISLEIARGCSRGCRFCQAGMVWRPVRERSVEKLLTMAEEMLSNTGYEELSLLSLSSGDYTCIEPLLVALMDRYYDRRLAIGLPSLRVETLSERMMDKIKQVRRTSFTLAPEAGSQRLRDIINKGNTDDDLLRTAEQVFRAGWKAIKLYFLVGLPGERKEDLEGLVDLTYRVLKTGKNRGQITLGLSTFVPKPHTPFQWERQISLDETREKQDYLKKSIRGAKVSVKWQDPRMSLLEGIFSRGDASLGRLIERAFRLGCRFDGWSDHLRFDLWEKAMEAEGIDVETYLGERSLKEKLPWEQIDCGVTKEFLARERARSLQAIPTADCRFGECQSCGVCGEGQIHTLLTSGIWGKGETKSVPREIRRQGRYRLKFEKTLQSRFLSHLEVSAALIRALRRAGVHFSYSQGFHPHPKVSFAHATAVGMESICEYADLEIEEPREGIADLTVRINSFLPPGLAVKSIEKIGLHAPSLVQGITAVKYEITLPASWGEEIIGGLAEKREKFIRSTSFLVRRETDARSSRDIRPLVRGLTWHREERIIELDAWWKNGQSVRPSDILTQVFGLGEALAKEALIRKTETCFYGDSPKEGRAAGE